MIGQIVSSDGKKFSLDYLLRINDTYIKERPDQSTLIVEKDGVKYLACTDMSKSNFLFLQCLKKGCTFKVNYNPKPLKYDQFN